MKKYWAIIVSIGIGLGIGLATLEFVPDITWWFFPVATLSLGISLIVQIIIHECGHLVFGLMTGYKVSSFRVLNMMLVKKGGKWSMKQYSIPGTAGQCLMIPPDLVDGKMPYFWYFAGGGIFNILASFLALPVISMAPAVVLPFMLVGMLLGLTNLIPMEVGGVPNDGMNLRLLKQDKSVTPYLWSQLKVAQAMLEGTSLGDIPFIKNFDYRTEDLSNRLILDVAIMHYNYLVESMQLEEALVMSEALLVRKDMLPLYVKELNCDLISLKLVLGLEGVEALYEETKKHIQLTKAHPSRQRVLYAYELLHNKDPEKAKEHAQLFEKTAAVYPHAGVVRGEREMMAYIDRLYDELISNEAPPQ